MYKAVNGVNVPLTPQEIADAQARDHYFETVTRPAQEAARVREDEMIIATQDLFNRLRTDTSAQIDAWFAANVTTPVQAIEALKTLAKIIALRL